MSQAEPECVAPLPFDAEGYLRSPPFLWEPGEIISCNLYLMRCGQFVKVGIAGDVKKRLGAIQGSNPLEVTIAKIHSFHDRRYAAFAECTCLRLLAPARTYGEWFDIDFVTARDCVAAVVRATRKLISEHHIQAVARQIRKSSEFANSAFDA